MNGSEKILVIDNFDSFTFNLVHLVEAADVDFEVYRNDELNGISIETFSHLLIGPGPGLPETSGDLLKFLAMWPKDKPVLGVCLGMQALLSYDGASIRNLSEVFHGAQEKILIKESSDWLLDTPAEFMAGRYHSWGYKVDDVSDNFRVIAVDEMENVMAVEHIEHPWFGVQYHPESIMTEHGYILIRNFVAIGKTRSLELAGSSKIQDES